MSDIELHPDHKILEEYFSSHPLLLSLCNDWDDFYSWHFQQINQQIYNDVLEIINRLNLKAHSDNLLACIKIGEIIRSLIDQEERLRPTFKTELKDYLFLKQICDFVPKATGGHPYYIEKEMGSREFLEFVEREGTPFVPYKLDTGIASITIELNDKKKHKIKDQLTIELLLNKIREIGFEKLIEELGYGTSYERKKVIRSNRILHCKKFALQLNIFLANHCTMKVKEGVEVSSDACEMIYCILSQSKLIDDNEITSNAPEYIRSLFR